MKDVVQLRIIWGGILTSQIFISVIPFIILKESNIRPTGENIVINSILVSIACVSAFMSFFISKFLLLKIKENKNLSTSKNIEVKDIIPALIIKFALIEGVSLMGIVAAMINQNWQHVIPFISVGIGLHLMAFPGDEKINNLIKK